MSYNYWFGYLVCRLNTFNNKLDFKTKPGLTVKSGNWKNLFKTWGLGNHQRTCEYI